MLGVRHRLNALPHVVRQSSWPRQLTSMSTFLTDVRTCLWERLITRVRMWNSSSSLRLLSAAIGLLLSICEAETAIIRHNYTMGAILNFCVSLCARRSQQAARELRLTVRCAIELEKSRANADNRLWNTRSRRQSQLNVSASRRPAFRKIIKTL